MENYILLIPGFCYVAVPIVVGILITIGLLKNHYDREKIKRIHRLKKEGRIF